MAKIQNTDHAICWQGCRAIGTLIHCQCEYKMVQPLCNIAWQFLTKLHIILAHKPAITFLGTYPNLLKTYVHTKTEFFVSELKKRFLKFIFRGGKGRRKRGRETSMCGCLSHAPYWGPGQKPRHES